MKNLSRQLIEHERIQTSQAKAKAVKPEVEKMITLAKRGDLHSRRLLLSRLGQDKFIVHKLVDEIAPRYTERPGGYQIANGGAVRWLSEWREDVADRA